MSDKSKWAYWSESCRFVCEYDSRYPILLSSDEFKGINKFNY